MQRLQSGRAAICSKSGGADSQCQTLSQKKKNKSQKKNLTKILKKSHMQQIRGADSQCQTLSGQYRLTPMQLPPRAGTLAHIYFCTFIVADN